MNSSFLNYRIHKKPMIVSQYLDLNIISVCDEGILHQTDGQLFVLSLVDSSNILYGTFSPYVRYQITSHGVCETCMVGQSTHEIKCRRIVSNGISDGAYLKNINALSLFVRNSYIIMIHATHIEICEWEIILDQIEIIRKSIINTTPEITTGSKNFQIAFGKDVFVLKYYVKSVDDQMRVILYNYLGDVISDTMHAYLTSGVGIINNKIISINLSMRQIIITILDTKETYYFNANDEYQTSYSSGDKIYIGRMNNWFVLEESAY